MDEINEDIQKLIEIALVLKEKDILEFHRMLGRIEGFIDANASEN